MAARGGGGRAGAGPPHPNIRPIYYNPSEEMCRKVPLVWESLLASLPIGGHVVIGLARWGNQGRSRPIKADEADGKTRVFSSSKKTCPPAGAHMDHAAFFAGLAAASPAQRAWAVKRVLELGYASRFAAGRGATEGTAFAAFTQTQRRGSVRGEDGVFSPRAAWRVAASAAAAAAAAAKSRAPAAAAAAAAATADTDAAIGTTKASPPRAPSWSFTHRTPWHSRRLEHQAMRQHVLEELHAKRKRHVHSKEGQVRMRVFADSSCKKGKWLRRTALLDTVSQELTFLHKGKQEGSVPICSIVRIQEDPRSPKEFTMVLSMRSVTLRCPSKDQAAGWLAVLRPAIQSSSAGGAGGASGAAGSSAPVLLSAAESSPRDSAATRGCSACGVMVGVGEAIGKGGGSGTLLTREAGADFFCSSTCIDFYEQTLRNGFKISISRNNNNAPPRLLVPFVSSQSHQSALSPTLESVRTASQQASAREQVLAALRQLPSSPAASSSSSSSWSSVSRADSRDAKSRKSRRTFVSTSTFLELLPPANKHVRFGTITLHEHERLPGGSGVVPSTGIPLGLGWQCVSTRTTTVDKFEAIRMTPPPAGGTNNPLGDGDDGSSDEDEEDDFQFHRDGRLEAHERLSLLSAALECDAASEFAPLEAELKRVRKERMQTVRSRTGKMVMLGEDPDEVAKWEAETLAAKKRHETGKPQGGRDRKKEYARSLSAPIAPQARRGRATASASVVEVDTDLAKVLGGPPPASAAAAAQVPSAKNMNPMQQRRPRATTASAVSVGGRVRASTATTVLPASVKKLMKGGKKFKGKGKIGGRGKKGKGARAGKGAAAHARRKSAVVSRAAGLKLKTDLKLNMRLTFVKEDAEEAVNEEAGAAGVTSTPSSSGSPQQGLTIGRKSSSRRRSSHDDFEINMSSSPTAAAASASSPEPISNSSLVLSPKVAALVSPVGVAANRTPFLSAEQNKISSTAGESKVGSTRRKVGRPKHELFFPRGNGESDKAAVAAEAEWEPKSPSDIRFLCDAIARSFLFARMSRPELEAVAAAMAKLTFETGDRLCAQSEPCDTLYVVMSGQFSTKRGTLRLGPGSLWGELGIVHPTQHQATLVCTSTAEATPPVETIVWAITSTAFHDAVAEAAEIELAAKIEALRAVPLFAVLDDDTLEGIAEAATDLNVAAGSEIIRQHDEGNTFYTIRSGSVSVLVDDADGEAGRVQVATLNQGQYFGEMALLESCKRSASVVAAEQVHCCSLTRRQFELLLGPVHSVLLKVSTQRRNELKKRASAVSVKGAAKSTADSRTNTASLAISEAIHKVVAEGHRKASALAPPTVGDAAALSTSDPTSNAAGLGGGEPTECPAIDLNEFLDLGRLGEGSFGAVRLVSRKDTPTQRFALKMISKETVEETQQTENILREKRLLLKAGFDRLSSGKAVANKSVVGLRGTAQDVGRLYMLMDVVQGGELDRLIYFEEEDVCTEAQKEQLRGDHGALSTPVARFFGANVVSLLALLHAKDIVFRDLKPENLIIGANGYLVLVDFGFAKEIAAGGKSFTLCGSAPYLAPEVILRKGHTRSVDFWSLGIILFEMVRGRTPFADRPDDSNRDIFKRILKGGVEDVVEGLPAKLRQLIAGLLEPKPQLRLGSLMEGIGSLTDHGFFDGFAWAQLADRSLEPPFVPVLNEFGVIALDPDSSDSEDENSDGEAGADKEPSWGGGDVHSSGGGGRTADWGEWASW